MPCRSAGEIDACRLDASALAALITQEEGKKRRRYDNVQKRNHQVSQAGNTDQHYCSSCQLDPLAECQKTWIPVTSSVLLSSSEQFSIGDLKKGKHNKCSNRGKDMNASEELSRGTIRVNTHINTHACKILEKCMRNFRTEQQHSR